LEGRLNFLVFCEFELGAPLLDSSTFCRFTNRLAEANRDEALLTEINEHLVRLGLKVNKARGAFIGASIIDAAARPNRAVDLDPEGEAKLKDSADTEARWVKKGKPAFFGYRTYLSVDTEDAFIQTEMARSASASETMQFRHVVRRLPERVERVLADKGVASAAYGQYLKRKRLDDLLQCCGNHVKPVERWHTQVNKLSAKMRYRVEQ
jgi:IS5 family transposase